MIGMGMRQDDCGRGDIVEAPEPVHSAINHDPRGAPRNEQGTVTAMASRTQLNFAARTEKRQFDRLGLRIHFVSTKSLAVALFSRGLRR
jgi:hypothetical protein